MRDHFVATFCGLLASNLRVVLLMFALGALAYGGWWVLAWLFPDFGWLQASAP